MPNVVQTILDANSSIRENTGKSQVKYSDRDNKYLDLAKDPEKNEAALREIYGYKAYTGRHYVSNTKQ